MNAYLMDRITQEVKMVLETIAQKRGVDLGEVEIFDGGENSDLLSRWNESKIDYDETFYAVNDGSITELSSTTRTVGEQLYVLGVYPHLIVRCVVDDQYNDERWAIYRLRQEDIEQYHQQRLAAAEADAKIIFGI